MNSFIVRPRATDYVLGANSPIKFKAFSNGSWTSRLEFFENQSLGFETEGCVLFSTQESFDAQMDNLIATGQVPFGMFTQFTAMGYMDTGLDGKPHFHSSARFLQVLTGNGFNGNAATDPWDVMRKYGVLPWKDLPYDATITQADYLAPIPQASLDKAAQFLALIGGKDSIQYHWIYNDTPRADGALAIVRQQAPLLFGVAVIIPGWNQVTPVDPPADAAPVHCVMNYDGNGPNENILDHYSPYEKDLDATYPVKFVFSRHRHASRRGSKDRR